MVSMVLDKVVSSDVAQSLFEFIVQGMGGSPELPGGPPELT
jgi:hypothetical protein